MQIFFIIFIIKFSYFVDWLDRQIGVAVVHHLTFPEQHICYHYYLKIENK